MQLEPSTLKRTSELPKAGYYRIWTTSEAKLILRRTLKSAHLRYASVMDNHPEAAQLHVAAGILTDLFQYKVLMPDGNYLDQRRIMIQHLPTAFAASCIIYLRLVLTSSGDPGWRPDERDAPAPAYVGPGRKGLSRTTARVIWQLHRYLAAPRAAEDHLAPEQLPPDDVYAVVVPAVTWLPPVS